MMYTVCEHNDVHSVSTMMYTVCEHNNVQSVSTMIYTVSEHNDVHSGIMHVAIYLYKKFYIVITILIIILQ